MSDSFSYPSPDPISIGLMLIGGITKASSEDKQATSDAKAVRDQAQLTLEAAEQVKSEADASDFNATRNERDAQLQRESTSETERRFRVQSEKKLGSSVAAYGASGVTLEGTAQDVLEESAMSAELDALTIRHEGELKAIAMEDDAKLNRFRAGNARKQAGITITRAKAAGARAADVQSQGNYKSLATLINTGATAYDTYKRTGG